MLGRVQCVQSTSRLVPALTPLPRLPALIKRAQLAAVPFRDDAGSALESTPFAWESGRPQQHVASRTGSEHGLSPTQAELQRQLKYEDYLCRILKAKVYDVVTETPLQHAVTLSQKTRNTVYLKREDLLPIHSFKLRGAYNKISNLTTEQLSNGVVACSAGNHAQGVAYSARLAKTTATIVMPCATPAIKVDAVRRLGGEVILHGTSYDEAQSHARSLAEERGLTMVHPFNDPDVIAGQGTIGVEILKQMRSGAHIDAIFCCVGGGGLIAGVAAYVKRIRPEVKIIGVEAADAAGMTASLRAGRVVTLPHVGLFADGAAVRTVGDQTFDLARDLVDGMVTVSTDEICAALKDAFNDTRTLLEPAGALALAGYKKYVESLGTEGRTYCVVSSGANMDFDRLRFVSERADSSETLISAVIPETPGAFNKLYDLVYPLNVTEFSYRMRPLHEHGAPDHAHICMSFQSYSLEQSQEVIARMNRSGFEAQDLTNNEMAKVHIRHMVGGRSKVKNERLIRFEFPEQPGALRKFLHELSSPESGDRWNVSLFHYRNHGSDIGRVLVGLQIPKGEEGGFESFLHSLGYAWVEESENPVYVDFMRD